MISFTYQYAHCPSNRIYKRALGFYRLMQASLVDVV
jgi:hypothetical protein